MVRYFIVLLWAILTILVFGIFGPEFVSAKSDLKVWGGFFIICVVWIPLSYGVATKLFKRAKNITEEM